MTEFNLPDVGEGLDEAEIIEWFVAVGDTVIEHQVLVSVETAKSIVEIPSPRAGVIAALGGAVGESIPVGAVLVSFEDAEAAPSLPAASPPSATPQEAVEGSAGDVDATPTAAALGSGSARPKASPVIRKAAAQRGIDLRTIIGTGPHGRILRSDLDQVSDQPQTSPTEPRSQVEVPAARQRRPMALTQGQSIPLRGLRKSIAQNMTQSWTTIPHVSDFREVDATELLALRRSWKVEQGPNAPGVLAFVVKATATALSKHPYLNSSITDHSIELHGQVDIGIATSTPDGLLVPVIKNCTELSIREIHDEIAMLVELARERKASPSQLGPGTYTVNNLAALQRPGSLHATPLIRPPEAGILAFGRVQDRVLAVNGHPQIVPTMLISSVADHRIVDGDKLFAFTSEIQMYLERPATLLMELN